MCFPRLLYLSTSPCCVSHSQIHSFARFQRFRKPPPPCTGVFGFARQASVKPGRLAGAGMSFGTAIGNVLSGRTGFGRNANVSVDRTGSMVLLG